MFVSVFTQFCLIHTEQGVDFPGKSPGSPRTRQGCVCVSVFSAGSGGWMDGAVPAPGCALLGERLFQLHISHTATA